MDNEFALFSDQALEDLQTSIATYIAMNNNLRIKNLFEQVCAEKNRRIALEASLEHFTRG